MASIGDVFMQLLFQDSQLVAEASRAGTKAGDAAGASASKSMGQRLKGSLGTLVSTGLGAALGAGFAIATKGAAELDAATQQLIADTGLTGDAAAQAKDQIASLYRSNLQGFDQVSAALSKVYTDLGLTGQAAGDAAALFLKFSTATGIDAAQGVTLADHALDAWNMTGADSAALLDKLVASHAKYGGSITENLTALGKLAPQMLALGGNIDDTIGLLNLFEVSGMDSSKAMFALNTAVQKLKPGQTLDDFIKQISAIEDPTLRAQAAVKIFGARGGVNLANALKPGITSLKDFVPTMQETADATNKAADAVESGFGAKFQLILHNVGGALAQFGQNFGSLLMVGTMIGPKFATAIAGTFGGVVGLIGPKLVGLMAPVMASTGLASGTMLGRAIAAAIPLGLIGLAAIPIVLAYTIIGGDLQKQADALTLKTQAFAAKASLDQLKNARQGIAEQLAQAGKAITEGGSTLFGGTPIAMDIFGSKDKIQAQLDILDAQIAAMEPKVAASAQDIAATIPKAIGNVAAETRAAALADGMKVSEGLAQGIHDARQKPFDAFNNLIEMLKHPLSKTHEFERLAKELVSKDLANGLTSADPEIRAAAAEVKKSILDRMAQMKPDAGIIGQATTQAIADGLKSKDPVVRANAEALQSIVQLALSDLPKVGTDAGSGVVDNLAAYLKSPEGKAKILSSIAAIIGFVRGGLTSLSNPTPTPKPKPNTPVSADSDQRRRAFGGAVSAMSPTWVGEHGIPELFVPRASGTVVPLDKVGQMGGGGTTNITVPITGLIRARDPFEIATQLKRLSSFGVLTPRREPA